MLLAYLEAILARNPLRHLAPEDRAADRRSGPGTHSRTHITRILANSVTGRRAEELLAAKNNGCARESRRRQDCTDALRSG
jgi:hypothetical protein